MIAKNNGKTEKNAFAMIATMFVFVTTYCCDILLRYDVYAAHDCDRSRRRLSVHLIVRACVCCCGQLA